jgi:hypothetical protein
MIRYKPPKLAVLVKILRANARELRKPYESRDADFEDDAAAWALREAAKRLLVMDKKLTKLGGKHA